MGTDATELNAVASGLPVEENTCASVGKVLRRIQWMAHLEVVVTSTYHISFLSACSSATVSPAHSVR